MNLIISLIVGAGAGAGAGALALFVRGKLIMKPAMPVRGPR